MKRAFKWTAVGFGCLIVVASMAAAVLYGNGRSRLNQTYEVDIAEIPIDNGPETVERGKHLVEAVVACGECHGEGLRGRAFFNDAAIGTVVSANLTGGEGGIGGAYSDADWIRAIRHGIDPAGKSIHLCPGTTTAR